MEPLDRGGGCLECNNRGNDDNNALDGVSNSMGNGVHL